MEKRQRQTVESDVPWMRPRETGMVRWDVVLVALAILGLLIIGAVILGIMSIADLVHGHQGMTWQHVTVWLQSNLWWVIALPMSMLLFFKGVLPLLLARTHTVLERAEAGKLRAQTRALNHALRHNKKNMPRNRYIALSDELGNYPQMIDAERTDYLLPGNVPGGNANINPQQLLKFVERMNRSGKEEKEKDQQQIAGGLPTNVRYEEIRDQIPRGHILVGIGRLGIETKERAVGALVWIVGLSGTGKTSTTVLRVEERHQAGHKFLGVDPHWFKPDSLTNAVKAYASSFIRPMAQTAEENNAVLKLFLNQFLGRKSGQIPQPWQPLTLLVDEVGSLMDSTDPLEKENADLLKRIARICGQEARNFNMGGIYISQQATGLAWLRKVALMVIVHQLLMQSEKELACNGDKAAAEEMKRWPIGRTYVYGVGFADGPRTVQQPSYEAPRVVEGSIMPDLPMRETHHSPEKNVFLSTKATVTGELVSDVSPLERRGEGLVSPHETGEEKVRVSEAERQTILGAAYAQLQHTQAEKVNRSKLVEALNKMDRSWNNKSWDKIKQVLNEEGL